MNRLAIQWSAFFSWKWVLLEITSAICLKFEIGETRWERISDKKIVAMEMVNDQKLTFSSHDDISGTGSRSEMNEIAFQRGEFCASNDRSLALRKLVSSEL